MTSKADPPPDYVETNDVTLSESSAKYQSPDKVIVKTETNRDLGRRLKCYKICLAILAVLVVLLLVIVAILAWRVAVKEENDDHPETNDRQTNNDGKSMMCDGYNVMIIFINQLYIFTSVIEAAFKVILFMTYYISLGSKSSLMF